MDVGCPRKTVAMILILMTLTSLERKVQKMKGSADAMKVLDLSLKYCH
jgi:hypothetical protein